MRAHMEQDLREQLVQQGAELDPETLAKVRERGLAARLACQRWSHDSVAAGSEKLAGQRSSADLPGACVPAQVT